ncbi:hypothetical protein GL263_25965 [Streptomyces durbertensis]|uniref:Uncharacterized protein n=1 Tax=Streptomyces durbertensis TaxID=2448886 RepID=A0ABR6ENP6_9ACTN|nr:hypothetical protein [Streptomyces durbertensis]
MEAWNFFEDLARGLGGEHPLPARTAVQDSAYEKLFGGGSGAWTPAEHDAASELLVAGVRLWVRCPVVERPRLGRTA